MVFMFQNVISGLICHVLIHIYIVLQQHKINSEPNKLVVKNNILPILSIHCWNTWLFEGENWDKRENAHRLCERIKSFIDHQQYN